METSYKEKYEQALAKAKEQYNYPCMRSCMGILEEIFPELKESEDEKIRHYLMNFVKLNDGVNLPPDDAKKALSWLEKQGQVKESTISQHENRTCEENGNSLTCEDEKVRKTLIDFFGRGAKYGGHTNGICDKDILAWLEKQDPKKHEEELENAYKTADKVQYKRGYEDAVKEMEKQGETFPVLSNSSNIGKDEQKPAEWSEEDEYRLNSCLNILQPKTFVENTETINTKWLKSLKDRVQPKQEWSKEDDGVLLESISVLQNNGHWVLADKLKSLRPQNRWKPSEGDIIILEKVIKGELEPKIFQAILQGILEQLKKLKEE